jgi:hypothetical protein
MRRFIALLPLALVTALLPASGAFAAEVGVHSDNMSYVKNIPYPAANGGTPNYGTDIEFAKVGTREYAFAGSYKNGMQIVDITNPANARTVARYDCGVTQGDVQVFRQQSKPGRLFVGYASDTWGDGTSTCYREAAALGFDVLKEDGTGKNGTFIAEITNPLAPKTVSFVAVEQGSHNHSIHPGGNYLYNSNSDLITSVQPAIEVFNISNFAAPRKVNELALPTRPGLGTESHDITFNAKGTRAYSAALSQGVIIDTSSPWAPTIVSSFLDPAINVWHQMDPFTMTDSQGNKREFLIAEDEVAGAVGTGQCPNGGVHVYEVTGSMEASPQKVGYWNIDELRPTDSPTDSCTAHVFDIHEREQIMTIAYYNGGVHVVDISGLMGVSLGDSTQVAGPGMREIGYYRVENGDGAGFADSWSFKAPRVSRTGDFYLYGNDIARGLDVYRFRAQGASSARQGTWLAPQQAATMLAKRPKVALSTDTAFFCLLPQ